MDSVWNFVQEHIINFLETTLNPKSELKPEDLALQEIINSEKEPELPLPQELPNEDFVENIVDRPLEIRNCPDKSKEKASTLQAEDYSPIIEHLSPDPEAITAYCKLPEEWKSKFSPQHPDLSVFVGISQDLIKDPHREYLRKRDLIYRYSSNGGTYIYEYFDCIRSRCKFCLTGFTAGQNKANYHE